MHITSFPTRPAVGSTTNLELNTFPVQAKRNVHLHPTFNDFSLLPPPTVLLISVLIPEQPLRPSVSLGSYHSLFSLPLCFTEKVVGCLMVVEDMLKPEVDRVIPLWKYLGTASGATLGFILGSIPGLVIGSLTGNRLGAVRDAKGKSVYAVFAELDGGQKAAILRGLAMKVLGHALS